MNTIVAISTAQGNAGIGIVRLSGEKSFNVLKKIFVPKNKSEEIKGYTLKYGSIINPKNNELVDEVLVSYFISPKSYTTENMCEINSHGGSVILRKILNLCLENGAILAEPGEFTKRAFLNGRIDLSQAEAVIDLINAKSEKEVNESAKQLKGVLANKINKIKDNLMSIIVDIEASIDYPEYDVEEVTNHRALSVLEQIKNELKNLEETFENGKIIKDGIKVAIIGKPNVGKSSLLNTMLNEDRAIVSNIEGTTRDTIEEYINLKGIPLKIIDTAGIRASKDEIEKIGIKKSKEIANDADFVIVMLDSTRPIEKEDEEILKMIENKNGVVLVNKIDIGENKIDKNKLLDGKEIIEISAKDGIGINQLYDEIIKQFNLGKLNNENEFIITNIRHKEQIKKSLKNVNKAIETIKNSIPIDIIQVYIREAWEDLGEITGETISENMIKEIFSKFCLGK